jgi:CheY-like chemotaxis protein
MSYQGAGEPLIDTPGVVPRPLSEDPAPVKLRILVAEDNEFNRELLEHLLTRQGHSPTMTTNGLEALALLERDRFDLLLLDIHMPELDGFQVVRAIRERERTVGGYLPVIAVTARSRKEDREICSQAGMDEYLVKPLDAADLWGAINRVLRTRQPHKPPGLDLFDPPVLLAACGGDAAMLRKMCRTLQARFPEHLSAIRGALGDQDAPRLREAAHKLCGMLSAFSTVASDQAAELEDLAARGQLGEAPPLVERLETVVQEIVPLASNLSVESLREHVGAVGDPDRSGGP